MQIQLEQLEKDYGIEWQEYELSKFFEIQNTSSFNKDKLTSGSEYDYVTRTSQNQGILQKTGFVNQENINSAGIWSLGLLQMDFFYRQKPWYAGQFVRKIIPKIELSKSAILYFTVLFNKQKESLLSGLVRDVDNTFLSAKVSLPIINSQIAFDFIEKFIATLNAERLATLNTYLMTTGLNDYALTDDEQAALDELDAVAWRAFKIGDLFDIKPTKNYGLSNGDLLRTKGNVPVVSNTSMNNGITAYVDLEPTEKGNIVTFSDTTTDEAIFYQPDDFVGYSHIQGMHKKVDENLGKYHYLFIVTAFKNAVRGKYDYGSKFNRANAAKEKIQLPINPDNTPDYNYMELVICAIQKVVIKNVVVHFDMRIEKTGEIL